MQLMPRLPCSEVTAVFYPGPSIQSLPAAMHTGPLQSGWELLFCTQP